MLLLCIFDRCYLNLILFHRIINLIYPFVIQALFFSIYICILFSFLCCSGFCVSGIKVVNSTGYGLRST